MQSFRDCSRLSVSDDRHVEIIDGQLRKTDDQIFQSRLTLTLSREMFQRDLRSILDRRHTLKLLSPILNIMDNLKIAVHISEDTR